MSFFGAIGDAFDSAVGSVFKVVGSFVGDIVGQLGKQQNMLEDVVRAPVQAIIDEVTGGIWTGDGANAFVEECQSIFLPEVQKVNDGIGGIVTGINGALEIMQQADAKAVTQINDLATEFENIYKN